MKQNHVLKLIEREKSTCKRDLLETKDKIAIGPVMVNLKLDRICELEANLLQLSAAEQILSAHLLNGELQPQFQQCDVMRAGQAETEPPFYCGDCGGIDWHKKSCPEFIR